VGLISRRAIRTASFVSLADVIRFLNAAFCCLVDFASPVESKRKLVGAVGIEPTTFGLKGRFRIIHKDTGNAKYFPF
jgi:hypothetical protein